jgi:hypothetical protein
LNPFGELRAGLGTLNDLYKPAVKRNYADQQGNMDTRIKEG